MAYPEGVVWTSLDGSRYRYELQPVTRTTMEWVPVPEDESDDTPITQASDA